jgi:F420H(2)-dependent quinone reductase
MPEEQRPKMYDIMTKSWLGVAFGKLNAKVYKASDGRLFGKMGDADLAVVTAIGRKSGKPREVPLIYGPDGDNVVLIASKAGHPTHPVWYLNMVANPKIRIQIGATSREYVVYTAEGEERERCWEMMCSLYDDYRNYQKWTDREIPVVVCVPAS